MEDTDYKGCDNTVFRKYLLNWTNLTQIYEWEIESDITYFTEDVNAMIDKGELVDVIYVQTVKFQ